MQKPLITLLLLHLLPLAVFAQLLSPDSLIRTRINDIANYDTTKLTFYQVAVNSRFAKPIVLDTGLVRLIRRKSIYQVDYVYTLYKQSPDFSQDSLNKHRLEQLSLNYPELFDNNVVEWKFYRQTAATTRDSASKLFHGFIFHSREMAYRDTAGRVTAISESNLLRALSGEHFKTIPDSLPFKFVEICDTAVSSHRKPTGMYFPKSKKKLARGIMYTRRNIIWKRKAEMDTIEEAGTGCYYVTDGIPDWRIKMDPYTSFAMNMQDTIVRHILVRKRKLDSILVVEDVTGSMSPYLAQTLEWRRTHTGLSGYHDFAFFNDGDSRPDGPIGRSNGVYCVHSEQPEAVDSTAKRARSMGGGGAGPENNIEAAIRAYGFMSQCKSILMIADNLAPVRDMRLLNDLVRFGKPVNIIVCGCLNGRVMNDYIKIAAQTGGTIYTMEKELDKTALSDPDK